MNENNIIQNPDTEYNFARSDDSIPSISALRPSPEGYSSGPYPEVPSSSINARETKSSESIPKSNDDKDPVNLNNDLGRKAYSENRYCLAISYFDESIKLDKEFAYGWYNKGLSLYQLRKFTEAICCFDETIKINPDYKEAWYNMGLAYDGLEEIDSAIKCYDHALKIDGEYSDALNNKSWMLANKGVIFDARELIDKALSKDKDNPYYLDTKAFIEYKSGNYQEALKIIDILENNKKIQFAHTWYIKGNIVIDDKKDYDKALKHYDVALQIDPKFVEALNAKAYAFFYKKNYKGAIAELKKAISIKPNSAIAHENLTKITNIENSESAGGFVEYWSSSRKKLSVLIGLIVVAGIITGYSLLYPHEQTVIIDFNGLIHSHNETKTTTTGDISNTNLIAIGLIVLLILSPVIKTAKVGPVELSFSTTLSQNQVEISKPSE